jgi:membrane protein YdbS with pleckstrin-like domain
MSYQFQGQRPHEEVVLVTHQHPFILLHSALFVAVFLLIPVVVYVFFPTGNLLAGAIVVGVAIAFLKAASAWYGWSRTLFLLTTERIVFLEQHGFFKRELVESPLKGIQQVSHAVTGLLHTVFGYGNLSLSTAASQQPIMIPNIPDPYAIQQEILQAQNGEGMIEKDEDGE